MQILLIIFFAPLAFWLGCLLIRFWWIPLLAVVGVIIWASVLICMDNIQYKQFKEQEARQAYLQTHSDPYSVFSDKDREVMRAHANP